MKIAIVINGEEMFSGTTTEFLVLVKNNKVEIAATAQGKPLRKRRTMTLARRNAVFEREEKKLKSHFGD